MSERNGVLGINQIVNINKDESSSSFKFEPPPCSVFYLLNVCFLVDVESTHGSLGSSQLPDWDSQRRMPKKESSFIGVAFLNVSKTGSSFQRRPRLERKESLDIKTLFTVQPKREEFELLIMVSALQVSGTVYQP
jgi:hypothetical protein